jgi:DNA-directed RNA polymerase subunit RPC12/RpoP
VDSGYYECKHCKHIFEEKSYFKLLMAPHMGTSRYVKCPKCGKRSMAKKVMSKNNK